MRNNIIIKFNKMHKCILQVINVLFIFILAMTLSLLKLKAGVDYGTIRQIPEKPNILFILVDDMGWNGLSCYGNPHVSTPNIDLLAEGGMKFINAYVAPECTPTRAEFLSGQYGARTGLTQVHTSRIYPNAPLTTPQVEDKLPENIYTIANMLQDAGYITAISGKWHVGKADPDSKRDKYGFNFVGQAEEKPWDQVDNEKATPAQTDEVLQFIKNNKDHPFFVYLSYYNIHTPLQAPDSLIRKYVKRGYPESTNRFGDATELPTAHYMAMINLLDNEIGRLLKELKLMALLDNTLIVFTSDNGGLNRAWNNCPLRGAKGLLYEGGIRVPLIVSWPGIVKPASQTDNPVHIIDFYATFREISGGKISEEKILDGISIVPLLKQNGNLKRDALFWHHPHYIDDYGKTPSSAILKGNYKLIYYYGDYLNTRGYLPIQNEPYGELLVGERIELFNIKKDPNELQNLIKHETIKAQELLKDLKTWLNKLNAPLPSQNENLNMDYWFIRANRN